MKKIFKYALILVAAAGVLASCKKEVEDVYTPASPDAENCYGVYFPVQEAAGSHVFNPTQEPTIDFTVARTETKGEIKVPIVATYSEEGIFETTDVVFADGQAETTFTLTFDKAKEGVQYTANFRVEDPEYASIYTSTRSSLDFSVMRVEMVTMKDEDGKDASFIFNVQPDFLADFGTEEEYEVEGSIQYYELDGVRYGSVVVPEEGGIWGSDAVINFVWYTNVDYEYEGKVYQPVEIKVQYTGYELDGAEVGEDHPCAVLFSDYYHHYSDLKGNDLGSYMDFIKNYGQNYLLSYYDGHGGFYFNLVYDIEGTSYWYGFCQNSVVGISDGFLRVDYDMSLATDFSQEGVTPIYIKTGADIESIKYAIYEGELISTQAANKAPLIEDGTDASVTFSDFEYDEEEAVKYATLGVSPETSGDFTLVAVGYDKDNKAQNSAYITFRHVAAEDIEEYAVKLSVGSEQTSARYEEEGYTAVNSFAYWINGEGLTDVHVAVVTTENYEKNGEAYLANLKTAANTAISADALEEVNGTGGYTTLATGLAPLTSYTVLVWATNGSAEDYATTEYTTDGLPYEYLCTGTYTYNGWWGGADDTQQLFIDPNYENTYVLTNWGGGVDFKFVLNEDNTIYIPTFYIGADHSSYGSVYYVDPFDWWNEQGLAADETRAVHSYYDPETNTYNFHFVLAVSAGSFGHFWESFTPNEDPTAGAPAKAMKAGLKVNTKDLGKKSLAPKSFIL